MNRLSYLTGIGFLLLLISVNVDGWCERYPKELCRFDMFERLCPDYCNDPVHGNWTVWTEWSACSVTCAGGERFRNRSCTNPLPQHGGNVCVTLDGIEQDTVEIQREECATYPCPINGGYTDWDDWSECSVTCGDGRQYRKRCCSNPIPQYGGKDCMGESLESKACKAEACPVDGRWSTWKPWSSCDRSCGYVGKKTRERTCTDPPPSKGGAECEGNAKESAGCNRQPCPVNGNFSAYTDWSECSDTCNGVQYRTRCCDNPAPMHNGLPCDGPTADLRPCNDEGEDRNCFVPHVDVSVLNIDNGAKRTIAVIPRVRREFAITIGLKTFYTWGTILEVEDVVELTYANIVNDTDGMCVKYLGSGDKVCVPDGADNQRIIVKRVSEPSDDEPEYFVIFEHEAYGVKQQLSKVSVESPQEILDAEVVVYSFDQDVEIPEFEFTTLGKVEFCPTKADIVYIMDSSISTENYFDEEEKCIVKHLVRGFKLSEDGDGSRGAVIVFSSGAEVKVKLSDETKSNDIFLGSIDVVTKYMPKVGESVDFRIDEALRMAKDDIFLPGVGDREDVPNLAVLIIDDEQTNVDPPARNASVVAEELREKGVKLFVIGVTDQVSHEFLKRLSGGDYNYLRAESWSELQNGKFIDLALEMVCRVLTHKTEVVFPSIEL